MTIENIDNIEELVNTDEQDAQERFAEILMELKKGKDLTNDDALFLVEIIRGLDNSYSINTTVVSSLGRQLPEMTKSLAFAILGKVGRNDQKTKRSVLKVCEQYIDSLWYNARQEAAAVALALLEQTSSTEDNTEEVAT